MNGHQITLWASGLVYGNSDVPVVIAECSCGEWRVEFPEPAAEAEVHAAVQAHAGDSR